MRSSVALLVPALLAVALTGAFAPAPAGAGTPAETNPYIVSVNHTANYLSVPDDQVSNRGTSADGLSLGTAFAAETHRLENEHERLAFERSFREVDDATNKTAVVRRVVDRADERKRALQRRDRSVTRAYANGSTTTGAFVRERARIDSEAAQIQQTVERARQVARNADSYSLPTRLDGRLASTAGELETLQGTVSARAAGVAAGRTSDRLIYAEASPGGYTMAYVSEDTYVRETYLDDERRPNGTNTFAEGDEPPLNAAHNRGYQLYPWVTNHSVSPNSFGLGRSGIYRFSVDFSNGQLTAYIDGSTTNVFREAQEQKLAGIPTSRTVSTVNGTLALRLNRTYETGPLEASLVRADTGVPVNGTVTVDGTPVGHTGDDGRLWLVEPSGPTRVNATTADDGTVSVYLPS